jgi:BMFP domain-containing protein YqiC
MNPVAEADVSTKEQVTTKEELAELKRRLAELNAQKSNAPSGNALSGKPYGWEDDIDGLAVFLEDLKQVMKFLVANRVLKQQKKSFDDCWEDVETRIDLAIAELRTIDSDANEVYVKLYNAGLTGAPLKVKIGEYWRRVKGSPVVAVLEMADRILGSLFPILSALEPVKEFKETLESKLKNDGDEGLQSININGREQWWKRTGNP